MMKDLIRAEVARGIGDSVAFGCTIGMMATVALPIYGGYKLGSHLYNKHKKHKKH